MTRLPRLEDLPPAPRADAMVDARRLRLERFRDRLRNQGLATGIVARPALIRHLSGVRVDAGALVVAAEDAWLAAPEGSIGTEAAEAAGIRMVSAPGYDRDAFVDAAGSVASAAIGELSRRPPTGPVGAELAQLPAAIAGALLEPPHDISPLLDDDRRHKDELELACLRRAVAVVERAFAAAADVARPGATERDLLNAVSESLYRDAGDDAQFAANIATGERTALDDPHATDRVIEARDLVLLDLYPVVEGHVADLTRTWVVGEASPAARERHGAIATALAAGASALERARTGADIDRAVRDSLAQGAGSLAGSMHHHTGHGIGVFGWERPWLGARSDDPVGQDTVVCIEPGLYEPGVGGIRLEGEFLLRDDGVERLDHFPDALLELPA
ncbi:MAG TPA: Xaa-Pro peptidase family protein [Candidatus Limnocylindrales bacterium]|nr:Xaa-Pro peptidase family protein [Candidatus Limnocylindrales bacterium]